MTGQLAILNVSAGDTKLTFDPGNKGETRRACAVVTDMLRRGFCVLVEVGKNEQGPLYQRVKAFDPLTAEYIIAGEPPEQEEQPAHVEAPSSPPPSRARGRKASATVQRIDARKSSAVAIAPTAGG